mmetsp:Transcript_9792/g.20737  ORF Transcript_9792/g.20737 Transcript_9792/m.20737 type:complete len:221 (-) Transcript_9792:488-1150(-)
MQHLHYPRIREDLVQQMHLRKDVEGVYDEVLLAGGELHKADKAPVGAEVVVLDIYCQLLPYASGLYLLDHRAQFLLSPHQHKGRVFHPPVVLCLPRLEELVRPAEGVELLLVRMRQLGAHAIPDDTQCAEMRLQCAAGLLPALADSGAGHGAATARPQPGLALSLHEPRWERHPLIVLDQNPGNEHRAVIVDQLAPPHLWLRHGGLTQIILAAPVATITV